MLESPLPSIKIGWSSNTNLKVAPSGLILAACVSITSLIVEFKLIFTFGCLLKNGELLAIRLFNKYNPEIVQFSILSIINTKWLKASLYEYLWLFIFLLVVRHEQHPIKFLRWHHLYRVHTPLIQAQFHLVSP